MQAENNVLFFAPLTRLVNIFKKKILIVSESCHSPKALGLTLSSFQYVKLVEHTCEGQIPDWHCPQLPNN